MNLFNNIIENLIKSIIIKQKTEFKENLKTSNDF